MRPALHAPVEGHIVERGVWCPHCLLPSALRVVVTPVADPSCRLGEFVGCADCGEHWRP
jgi:hypothetical protein